MKRWDFMPTDLERIIEAREGDVADGHVGNPATAFDYCKKCYGLAALGPDSVALARALYWLLEYLDTRDAGRAPLIEAEQARQALLAWAQAGEERGKVWAWTS